MQIFTKPSTPNDHKAQTPAIKSKVRLILDHQKAFTEFLEAKEHADKLCGPEGLIFPKK